MMKSHDASIRVYLGKHKTQFTKINDDDDDDDDKHA